MTGSATRQRWLALYVLCAGVLMIVLDTTIVNVALPSIREDLRFTETSLVWVVNAYMLTFGGFLLLGGRLGDLFGHRRLFLLGITLFTLASLACGAGGLAADADRRARRAGHRRCDRLRRRAVADHGPVHRARRSREGDGHLRLRLRSGRQRRRPARRRADERASTGTGYSSSTCRSASRCTRAVARCCRTFAAHAARQTARHRRRGHRDVGADARRIRDRQWQRRRLDIGADDRACWPARRCCSRFSSASRRRYAHR